MAGSLADQTAGVACRSSGIIAFPAVVASMGGDDARCPQHATAPQASSPCALAPKARKS